MRREQLPAGPSLLSRRRFLSAGAALLPTLSLLPACGKRVEDGPPGEPGGLVLKAGRFSAAPDGRAREVWGYNGQLPGPVIRAREGETLRVPVVNDLGVPTSIHWHGMHQPGTWTMDGVEEVSRPPIPPGDSFTYEFRATPAGTHWYHSHVGVQYGNGLFGPLIVEERTPIAAYDREEILFLNDWFLQPGDALFAEVIKGMGKMDMKDREKMEMKDVGDVPFQSALVNGKGRAPGDKKSPLAVVVVNSGEKVRLRLINGSSTYALRFQIDDHPLTVIATDGAPLKPVRVDNLVLGVGERYDVLLEADRQGPHWIRAVTLDGKEALAILNCSGPYASGSGTFEAKPLRWGAHLLTPEEMRSPEPAALAAKPREVPIRLGGSMRPYRWSIDGQFYPKADPIVLDKGEPVRFLFHNPTGMDHPFHLHGHYFRVLGRPGALNLADPPQKDTVNVPAKSDLVIQWEATNPGRWFFHCHIEWHLATGMARVIEIKPF